MQLRRRYCCQGVVIGFILALCLYTLVSHASLEDTPLQSLLQKHSKRPPVMPLMGTQQTTLERTLLNCSQIPRSKDHWKVYAKSVVEASKAEQQLLQEGDRKGAAETTAHLHKCLVEVELSPCSCMRIVVIHLPGPCPSTSPQWLLHHIKTTLGESACGDIATLRGTAQKVLSYSVGGPRPSEYVYGLTQLAPRLQQVYPGWIMRIYTDNSTNPYSWVCPLACHMPYVDFCDASRLPGLGNVSDSNPRVWRFAVMGDPLVRLYLMRDADAPLAQREVDAVNSWLRSGTCYHAMRDHPFHVVPMMAGMWGGCQDNWNSKTSILSARNVALCGSNTTDQTILTRLVWPVARLNGTFHDAYTCRSFPQSLPFPTQRDNYTFVGQRTYRKRFRLDSIHKECPPACRPKEHQDWLYC